MKRLLFTTLLGDIAGCLFTGILVIFQGGCPALPFILLMTFMNIFIPAFLLAASYQVIKDVSYLNFSSTLMLHCLILSAFAIIGAGFWTICDAISVFGIKGLNFTSISDEFNVQFLGYIPATLTIALTIPVFQQLVSNRLFPPAQ